MKMTQEEKITCLDIALRIAGFNAAKEAICFIVEPMELIESKKGETTLDDIVKVAKNHQPKIQDGNNQTPSAE